MNSESRSLNSLRNLVIGVGSQVIILLLMFVGRTIFINVLGAEYLGVNGLFTNILSILSLAELGIGNVMIYSLYKPIAENDKATICVLLNYYKNIYRKIAIVILILGLCVVPFLDKIVNSDIPVTSVILYYILFLANSVVSYLVVYKSALINADQKIYIIKVIQTIVIIIKEIAQIIILLTTKSFILYLSILIISTILNNVFLNWKANKLYPFIKLPSPPTKIDTNTIKENIKAVFIYKIGVVLMNNTDNILISILIGTVYVGYYSNYSLLVTTVMTVVGIIIQSLFSSLGNMNASGDMVKSYKFFNGLVLFFHWLSAFCALSFLLVFNDFITVWIGEKYLLDINVVLAIVLNFYIQNIINPVWMYRETMGLFNQIKYIMIIAAILNLVFSILLGLQWGMTGIILSTVIARLMTTVWYEPRLLYRLKFKQPIRNYWIRQIKYSIITIIAIYISVLMTKNMPVSFLNICIKIFIGFLVVSVLFLITNFKSEEFRMLKGYALRILKK